MSYFNLFLCKPIYGHSGGFSGLPVRFKSPVALNFAPVANLFLYGRIVSSTGKFTRNIKGPSNTLSCSSCYGLLPILTALLLFSLLFPL